MWQSGEEACGWLRKEETTSLDNLHKATSHRVGLTTHGKGEVKFVNCTEIHAVHFRGQLWYQIILRMQIPSQAADSQLCTGTPAGGSPSAWPARGLLPGRRDPGGWLLEQRGEEQPAPPERPLAPDRAAPGDRAQGCRLSGPWPVPKVQKARGLHI